MNKKYLFIILPIILVLILSGFIFGYTYTVEGTVTNIATKQPVEGIVVKVANHKSVTDEKGNYRVEGIKLFQKENLIVEIPNREYERVEPVEISYDNRINKKDFTVEPTLEQISNLVNTSVRYAQYDYLWNFMHPDDKEYWGDKDEYVNLFKEAVEMRQRLEVSEKSNIIGNNIRILEHWKHTITGKEYNGVMEVPVETIIVRSGVEQPETTLNYYQWIDGFYHYFTKQDKKELKEIIEAYKELIDLFNE